MPHKENKLLSLIKCNCCKARHTIDEEQDTEVYAFVEENLEQERVVSEKPSIQTVKFKDVKKQKE